MKLIFTPMVSRPDRLGFECSRPDFNYITREQGGPAIPPGTGFQNLMSKSKLQSKSTVTWPV